MIEFKRSIEKELRDSLFKGKVLIVYGPRQSGKTTLVKKIAREYEGVYFSCEEPDVAGALTHQTSTAMKNFLGNKPLVILDEAQKIVDIGTTLKLLHDAYPEMQIIATGSSSFDLANKINEPLTGRHYEFYLYPLSLRELSDTFGELETKRLLEARIIYGTYPEIIADTDARKKNLTRITQDYLFKDLLSFGGVRKPLLLQGLLKLLALQIGNQVSFNELSQSLGVGRNTIESYITLLEQAYIIFRLYPYTKNRRDEIKKMPKIYFYDTGIRNMLVNNLNGLDIRNDVGALWENFCIADKMKEHIIQETLSSLYYWRTKSGQEIDLIEEFESGQSYYAYEYKWKKDRAIPPSAWSEAYANTQWHVITPDTIFNGRDTEVL